MKDILLIQPPVSFHNDKPVLPQNSVGIGMLTIMAYLKRKGYSGEVIHIPRAEEEGFKLKDIINRIKEANPKVIAIGLNWLHFGEGALELARLLRKEFPNMTIVVGGQHATLFAEEILRLSPDIDGITIGESEKTMCFLVEAVIRESRRIPEGVPGVMTLREDRTIALKNPELVDNLDELPLYSYKDVWPYTVEVCAALDTVRGECMKNCSYCIESKTSRLQGRKKFTWHSGKYLAAQIKSFMDDGTRNITIQDSFTMVGDKAIQEFCDCLMEEKIKINLLNIFTEPRIFQDKTIEKLKQVSNIVTLDFGMETGAKDTGEFIGRGFDKDEILMSLKKLSSNGVKVLTWWMTGLPGETEESLRENMDYIVDTLKCGAIPRWVTPLILFPHTDMSKNKDYYGVIPHIKTFSEFCSYSKVKANVYAVYPELLTHETSTQSPRKIIEATIALKKGIITSIDNYKNVLCQYGWKESEVEAISNEAKGSFF